MGMKPEGVGVAGSLHGVAGVAATRCCGTVAHPSANRTATSRGNLAARAVELIIGANLFEAGVCDEGVDRYGSARPTCGPRYVVEYFSRSSTVRAMTTRPAM